MSMPSLDFFKSAPATEVLRVESEPPGADARTTQGQSCRTPCELTVPSGGELSVSFALNGYQPQTLQVHAETPGGASYGEGGSAPRLQPNPVYAELQPARPPGKKKAVVKKTAKKTTPTQTPTQTTTSPDPNYPAGYPWPDPQPR